MSLLLDADHTLNGSQANLVVVDPLAPTRSLSKPSEHTSGQPSRQPIHRAQPRVSSAGDPLGDDQWRSETQSKSVVTVTNQPPNGCTQTHADPVGWLELRICGDLFDRSQQERIAVANVIRRPQEGGNIDPTFFAHHLALLEATEHEAELMLGRCYRRVAPPELRAWQLATPGIGDKLFARLLGHLGDPYIATPHYWEGTGAARQLMVEEARPRTVSQLWQYAGHGDPHCKKSRGMSADEAFALGSPIVKMLVHLLAEACLKLNGEPDKNGRARARSPYREIYDLRRLLTADRLHATDCVRCGPSGKPASAGSPWSKAHQHADALRIVGKEILRDLWLISRSLSPGAPKSAPHGDRDDTGVVA